MVQKTRSGWLSAGGVAAWLVVWPLLGAAPPSRPDGGPPRAGRPVSAAEAEEFATTLLRVIDLIAQRYYQPIAPEELTARALVALYEAAGVAVPPHLRGDPKSALVGRDLRQEVEQTRRALGNPPSLMGNRALRAALNGVLAGLDPHSSILWHEDRLAETVRFEGGTIGLTIEEPGRVPGPVYVRSVQLDGPACQAGIQPGDELLAIDGEVIPAGMTNTRLSRWLSGAVGRERQVTFRPMGESEARQVTVLLRPAVDDSVRGVRRLDDGRSWDYWLDRKSQVALVRLGMLQTGTSGNLGLVLAMLQESGLSGVVLDLRDCPGGALQAAADICSLFLPPESLIAKAQYRGGEQPEQQGEEFRALENMQVCTARVAVLIGPDTTGGGELIAAALQDHRRARLFGSRTRGKGTIQRTDQAVDVVMRPNPNPFTLTLTSGLLIRPSGQPLQRLPHSTDKDPWGVRPDPEGEIRLPMEQIRQIRRWRHQLDLRPAGRRDLQRLDLPENDPVLHAAWRWLTQPAAGS